MIKRFTWFVGGLVAGVSATLLAGRRLRRRVASLAPTKVVRDTASRVRRRASEVSAAIGEGRRAMRDRESELRARVEGRSDAARHRR